MLGRRSDFNGAGGNSWWNSTLQRPSVFRHLPAQVCGARGTRPLAPEYPLHNLVSCQTVAMMKPKHYKSAVTPQATKQICKFFLWKLVEFKQKCVFKKLLQRKRDALFLAGCLLHSCPIKVFSCILAAVLFIHWLIIFWTVSAVKPVCQLANVARRPWKVCLVLTCCLLLLLCCFPW